MQTMRPAAPGSSYFASGDSVNPMDKIRNVRVAITSGAAHMWDCYTSKTPFSDKEKVFVQQDFFGYVPKNFKSLRTISIGNDGNTLLQLSHGRAIRKKLKRFYDLDVQHELHKEIVKESSITRSHATVDIKNASNSVCKTVVKRLLPPVWFDLLDKSRHHKTQIGNYVHDLELFSSMGNGFTFELESLLFYCIARAAGCHSDEVWIYGDDIIVPQERVPKVVDALSLLGFSLNQEKSFTEGLFFESCGVHVFNGCDVTPFYIKDLLHEPKDVLRIANELRLFATRLEHFGSRIRHYLPVYRYLVGRLPDAFRARGPAGGGLCLFSNIEEFGKGCYQSGAVTYSHLLPCFKYYVQSQYEWSLDQVLAFELDKIKGPLPTVNPFKPLAKKGSQFERRTSSLQSIKALHRRYRKLGIGETPYLLDYRLFTIGNHYEDPDSVHLPQFPMQLQWELLSSPWLDVRDSPNAGNGIGRVDYRPWSPQEIEDMPNRDRSRAGKLAHGPVS